MVPEFCTDQPFDGSILGAPVWRLNDPERAGEAVAAARDSAVALISHRGPSETGALLEPHGFRNVETLVTFEGAMPSGASAASVRLATPDDADAVGEIAATSFTTDRWHADPLIPNERANAFKAAWAKNDVMGRADAVLLAVADDDEIAGFNAVLLRDGIAIIDLIAVAPGYQGNGFGRALIQGMASAFPDTETVRVGTQASNAASQRLYASVGWREIDRAETWHWVP